MLSRVEPARHVMLAVPAYAGGICTETVRSLLGATDALRLAGIEVSTLYLDGCCYLDLARNKLVRHFLASQASDLLFVDADVGFEPADAVRLCRSARPVVAAIYPKKVDEPAYPVATLPGEIWSDDEGLIECEYVPTGCMRINRGVFDAMRPNVPVFATPDDGEMRAYFQCAIYGGEYVGEDVEFCRRWRRIGGKVHAFPDMTLTHTGSKTWRGEWGGFMKARIAA